MTFGRGKIEHDQLILQTLIPKFMGPLNNWQFYIREAVALSYNAIHFCPFQKRGLSNSPYSINDQLELSDDLFTSEQQTALSTEQKWDLLARTIQNLQESYPGLKFIADIVWNHTSFDSDWLKEYPESAYTPDSFPHLKMAVVVDLAIDNFCKNLAAPIIIQSPDDINVLLDLFFQTELFSWKLERYWRFNQDAILKTIKPRSSVHPLISKFNIIDIVEDKCQFLYEKFVESPCNPWQSYSLSAELLDFLGHIEDVNPLLKAFSNYLLLVFKTKMEKMRRNLFQRIHYERLDPMGPHLGPVSQSSNFSSPYFTRFPKHKNSILDFNFENEALIFQDWTFMANNGWIWDADPLVNFALPPSDSYFTREIIIWGDCVKLNYTQPSIQLTLPYLYQHMSKYTALLVNIFDGLRLDNCHSTPVYAANYLLDVARDINPNLFVFAELFTGSEQRDLYFIDQLALDCLLREALAWNYKEAFMDGLSKIGEKYPIGSVRNSLSKVVLGDLNSPRNSNKKVLLMDCTHDNKMPAEQSHGLGFYLGNAALTAMSCGSIGSTKGYDTCELRQLDFIHSSYQYPRKQCDEFSGLEFFKKYFYELRATLMQKGFNEMYIESYSDSNIVKITRENPLTLDSFVMVVNLNYGLRETPLLLLEDKKDLWKASCLGSPNGRKRRWLRNSSQGLLQEEITLNNVDVTVLASFRMLENIPKMEYALDILGLHDFVRIEARNYFVDRQELSYSQYGRTTPRNASLQHGCYEQFEVLQSPRSVNEHEPEPLISSFSQRFTLQENEVKIKLSPTGFQNGSVFLFKKAPMGCIKILINEMDAFLSADWPVIQKLDHVDLNIILYRTQEEDRDIGQELSGYVFPGVPHQFVYQGLEGILPFFNKWIPDVDQSAVAENIRQGDWFVDYILKRLNIYGKRLGSRLLDLANFLEAGYFRHYKTALPSYLKPRYLINFLQVFKEKIVTNLLNLQVPPLEFSLAVNVISLLGFSESGSLFPLPLTSIFLSIKSFFLNLLPYLNMDGLKIVQNNIDYFCSRVDGDMRRVPSLSAGLEFFTAQHMRVWGRDTFISFAGIFLNPLALLADGLCHVLAFASCAKHAFLIPNLLDSGRFPRYNCRDATWFFVKACQEFTDYLVKFSSSPSEVSAILATFLEIEFPMRFPNQSEFCPYDDSLAYSKTFTVRNLLMGIFSGHLKGISFREWNAGLSLDHAMQAPGFQVDIYTDVDLNSEFKLQCTGFVYGGNQYNAGTWMDKMGDSLKAGNSGKPGSSRHGAAIEITALLYRGIIWMYYLAQQQLVPACPDPSASHFSWTYWKDLIKANFCTQYKDGIIYKDVLSGDEQEKRVRPNIFIAMAISPKLFHQESFQKTFDFYEQQLLGPCGLRTLSPDDPLYRPEYNNDDDSEDPFIAHGWNYHNGPEWIWLRGFYYFAKIEAAKISNASLSQTKISIMQDIQNLEKCRYYGGLPELTNLNGAHCPYSCFNQAWSTAVILQFLLYLRSEL